MGPTPIKCHLSDSGEVKRGKEREMIMDCVKKEKGDEESKGKKRKKAEEGAQIFEEQRKR